MFRVAIVFISNTDSIKKKCVYRMKRYLAVVMVLSMMVVVPMTASATTVTDSFNSAYDTTNEFTISTANDLVAFAKSVYNGKNYYTWTYSTFLC